MEYVQYSGLFISTFVLIKRPVYIYIYMSMVHNHRHIHMYTGLFIGTNEGASLSVQK